MIAKFRFFTHELKNAFVSLLKLGTYSSMVVATLGLTLAALAVVVNINYLVLSKPLPYPDADNLIVTDQSETIGDMTQYGFQILSAQFHIYQDDTFIDSMALMRASGGQLRDVESGPYVEILQVTPEYFPLLGVPMAIGRTLSLDEGINDQKRVVVLNYNTWQNHFNGDPSIIGTTTRFDNDLYEIIGVTAQEFAPPEVFGSYEVGAWMSFSEEVSATSHWGAITGGVNGLARLKPGISLTQASNSLGQQINDLYLGQGAAPDTSIGARFLPLKTKIIGDSSELAYTLLAGVITLLLIAVSNLSNLFFSRAAQKQRTMAIQAALGAQPRHLFVGVFSEALWLISSAWVIGMVLAAWILVWLGNDLQLAFPRMQNLSLDRFTLFVSGAISLIIAVILSIVSVRKIQYDSLVKDLHVSGKGTGAQISSRTRNVLIATQVCFATIMLMGASELLHPVYKKLTQPLGFEGENLHFMRVDTGNVEEGLPGYSLQMKAALLALPEVESVARSYTTPLAMGWENYLYDANNEMLGIVSVGMFDEDLFSVMKQPILEGRGFTPIVDADAIPQEMVVSESLAKRLYGNESAIGKTLHALQNEPLVIVGVVADIYIPSSTRGYAEERYYLPFSGARMGYTLRTTSPLDEDKLLATIKNVNPSFGIAFNDSFASDLNFRLRNTKLTGVLTLALVLLALSLAAAGIYGVLSYSVQMRRYELGIRLSLGAHTQAVIRMVMKQSLVPIVIGLICGVLVALAMNTVATVLWQYQLEAEWNAFILALPIMVGIAMLACYWPIRSAVMANPIKALRNE